MYEEKRLALSPLGVLERPKRRCGAPALKRAETVARALRVAVVANPRRGSGKSG
jgi:hypothetical protein